MTDPAPPPPPEYSVRRRLVTALLLVVIPVAMVTAGVWLGDWRLPASSVLYLFALAGVVGVVNAKPTASGSGK